MNRLPPASLRISATRASSAFSADQSTRSTDCDWAASMANLEAAYEELQSSSNRSCSRNFLNLDIGLPTAQLLTQIRACLNGDGDHMEQVVPATNRRGRAITCRVTVSPLSSCNEDVRGSFS